MTWFALLSTVVPVTGALLLIVLLDAKLPGFSKLQHSVVPKPEAQRVRLGREAP